MLGPLVSSFRSTVYIYTQSVVIGRPFHSISQTYRNNGDFDFIDSGLNFIGPDIYGIISTEEINSINSIDSPIKTPNISDNKYKVVATVDLSISDSQLKNEFAEFLENKRNELDLKPIVEEIKKKDKVTIIKHGVLQYLDPVSDTQLTLPTKLSAKSMRLPNTSTQKT